MDLRILTKCLLLLSLVAGPSLAAKLHATNSESGRMWVCTPGTRLQIHNVPAELVDRITYEGVHGGADAPTPVSVPFYRTGAAGILADCPELAPYESQFHATITILSDTAVIAQDYVRLFDYVSLDSE